MNPKVGDTIRSKVDKSKNNLFIIEVVDKLISYYLCREKRFKKFKTLERTLSLEYFPLVLKDDFVYCRNILIEKNNFND
jgi:hypothetical protein